MKLPKSAKISHRDKETNAQDFKSVYFKSFLPSDTTWFTWNEFVHGPSDTIGQDFYWLTTFHSLFLHRLIGHDLIQMESVRPSVHRIRSDSHGIDSSICPSDTTWFTWNQFVRWLDLEIFLPFFPSVHRTRPDSRNLHLTQMVYWTTLIQNFPNMVKPTWVKKSPGPELRNNARRSVCFWSGIKMAYRPYHASQSAGKEKVTFAYLSITWMVYLLCVFLLRDVTLVWEQTRFSVSPDKD